MAIDPTSPTAAYDIQLLVGACIRDRLDPPAARICLGSAGGIAWDNCCGDEDPTAPQGQLVVSWQRDFYTDDGTAEVNIVGDDNLCLPSMLGFEFIVNVMRCTQAITEGGSAPSCDVVDAAGLQVAKDRAAVRAGLVCCLNALLEDGEGPIFGYQILPTTAAGAGGGCIGSDTPVRVMFPLCPVCES